MKALYIALLVFLLPFNVFAQWVVQRTGTFEEGFYEIYFVNYDYGWTIDDGAFFWTVDGGAEWHKRSLSGGIWRSIYFLNDSIGFVGGTKIMKTTNSGFTWTVVKDLPQIRLIESFDFLDDSTGFAVGGQRLFYNAIILKTTDVGNTWNEVSSPTQDCHYSISAYKISETSSRIVIVGNSGTIFTSTDQGNSWSTQVTNRPHLLDVQFISADLGWISSYARIYRTSNGGEDWFYTSVDPSHVEDYWTIFFADSIRGWTSSGRKIHASSDGGITWEEQWESNTPENPWIYSIYFIDKDMGWASGSYGLILSTQNGGITFAREKNFDHPNNYTLSQNYPNPFNPSTSIHYQFPELSFVTLKVYDVLGREVTILVNEEKPAGIYEVEFDGVNLPSGIYLYRLYAGNFIETKKMVLLK